MPTGSRIEWWRQRAMKGKSTSLYLVNRRIVTWLSPLRCAERQAEVACETDAARFTETRLQLRREFLRGYRASRSEISSLDNAPGTFAHR